MCLVSEKVKFCTCRNAENLKHYWILHRYNKDKMEVIVGEALLPFVPHPSYDDNQATFLNRLSEKDAFDFLIEFKEKDTLMISINSNNEFKEQIFAFAYIKEEWVPADFDYFDLLGSYDIFEEGKFKNLMQK